MSYLSRDKDVISYETFSLEDGTICRGKRPTGDYFACLGAAQTFGCYVERPFPSLLEPSLKLDSFNLGFGGVGPRFFLERRDLIELANRGKFAIVQIMSARSEGNSLFQNHGKNYGVFAGREMTPLEFWTTVLRDRRDKVAGLVAETRDNYVQSMLSLLGEIRVPKILFWFSKRQPEMIDDYSSIHKLWGEFPHMVNRRMLRRIASSADELVVCVSRRGSPQRLKTPIREEFLSIFYPNHPDAGKLVTHNRYYPSPEMHEDAADSLKDVCVRYL